MQWIWLEKIKEITLKFGLGFIYKTSFDKANRTSLKGERGAGLDASLPVFDKIKKELNVPILTDIHNAEQCENCFKNMLMFYKSQLFYVDKQTY